MGSLKKGGAMYKFEKPLRQMKHEELLEAFGRVDFDEERRAEKQPCGMRNLRPFIRARARLEREILRRMSYAPAPKPARRHREKVLKFGRPTVWRYDDFSGC